MLTLIKKRLSGILKSLPRRTWLLVLIPLSMILTQIAKHQPEFAEQVFALGFYRVASQAISAVMGLLPFSLLEFGIITIAVILIVILARFIHKLMKSKGERVKIAGRFLLNAGCVGSVVLIVFTVLCGVNYYRHPFSYYSGLEIKPSTVDELYALCAELTADANAQRAKLGTLDERGTVNVFDEGYQPVAQRAREAMGALAERYDVLDAWYPKPKAVFFSKFMSRTEITGVYSPFTMEANVNVAATEYTIPATMCHELSHLRGFMREDEANFIAYLACRASDDAEFQYSGTMLALVYTGNQLYRADADRYFELREEYSEGVNLDMRIDAEYWQQFDNTVISKVSNTVNDTYLKANNQTDGVKSYGRMVDLLLADYRQRHAE